MASSRPWTEPGKTGITLMIPKIRIYGTEDEPDDQDEDVYSGSAGPRTEGTTPTAIATQSTDPGGEGFRPSDTL